MRRYLGEGTDWVQPCSHLGQVRAAGVATREAGVTSLAETRLRLPLQPDLSPRVLLSL